MPEQVRGILCALASGWVPDPMRFGRVAQLRYNELDLSKFAPELSLHLDKLQVTSPFKVPWSTVNMQVQ